MYDTRLMSDMTVARRCFKTNLFFNLEYESEYVASCSFHRITSKYVIRFQMATLRITTENYRQAFVAIV